MTTATRSIPRRWNVEVDGIRWIPRMIDKAKMSANGTLGSYLMGHSPVDHALLTRLGITTAEFVRLANDAPSDLAVLEALRKRGFDEERVRRWSANFESTYKTYVPLWDVDEGYIQPRGFGVAGLKIFRVFEAPLMGLVRKVRAAP